MFVSELLGALRGAKLDSWVCLTVAGRVYPLNSVCLGADGGVVLGVAAVAAGRAEKEREEQTVFPLGVLRATRAS